MKLLLRYFVILSAVSLIKSQIPAQFDELPRKPDRCHGPIDMLNEQCCLLPPFFARDIAKNCGAKYAIINNDIANNITYRRRHLIEGCESWTCILTQYKFVTSDGNFDDEKYYDHLDRWVELNPDFSDIMAKVKITCKELAEPYFPLELCEFTKIHFCIRRSIELECPVVKNSELCLKQKIFFDECREYYLRK